MAAPVIPAKGTPEIPVLATKPALKTISATMLPTLSVQDQGFSSWLFGPRSSCHGRLRGSNARTHPLVPEIPWSSGFPSGLRGSCHSCPEIRASRLDHPDVRAQFVSFWVSIQPLKAILK
ncbi:hypothetical protein R3I94_010232 [Phoxinus phoxinus]